MVRFRSSAAFVLVLGLLIESVPKVLANLPVENLPAEETRPTQAQCLTALQTLLRPTPATPLELEQARTLLKRCNAAYWVVPDPDAPLPTLTECVNFLSLSLEAVRKNELENLEPGLFEGKSLTRCKEIIETRYIPSGAMLPTLQVKDRVLIDKTAYRSQPPQRGDIVIFQPTETLRKQNFRDAFIKRVIGLPGERLEIKNGLVYINRKPLQEKYIQERPDYQYGPVVIPTDQYFMLGDNRNNSYDSHYWGFVPRSLIIGKAIVIYCPVERQRVLNPSGNMSTEKASAISTFLKSSKSLCASFSNAQSMSPEAEAKQNVSLMNRWQQAFYLEKNRFATNLKELGLSIPSETKSYKYQIIVTDEKRLVQNVGIAKIPGLKSFVGVATIEKVADTNEVRTITPICESNQPTTKVPPQLPISIGEVSTVNCPIGYSPTR